MASAIIIVVALVLAPGLQSASVQTRDLPGLSNYPQAIEDRIQTLPETIDVPALRPLPLPLPEPELTPEPVGNPCDACFSYMTALIEQLADNTPQLPDLPEVVPEIEPHPMPEAEVLPEAEILPHPMPEVEVVPEVEILPHPMPEAEVLPEVETLPLPVPEVEVEVLPEVLPVEPETRPLPVQPEFVPLPSVIDQ